jgi:hypothetical protein
MTLTTILNEYPEDLTMRALKALFQSRRDGERDASSVRRAMQIWAETGTVPVAHMVAELDCTTEYPATG